MDLVWVAGAWGVWFAACRVAFAVSGRWVPPVRVSGVPVPAAVLGLVRGRPARAQYVATVLDLGGRGWLDVDRARVALPGEPPAESLWEHERYVLRQVAARMAGAGDAPLGAVVPGAADLRREFTGLVRRSAGELGLAGPRWRTRAVPVLLAVTLLVPGSLSLGLVDWGIFEVGGFVALLAASWGIGRGIPRYRITPAGRALAASDAVEPVGDRRTAEAAAELGRAREAETWSARNGRWRRVEVDRTPSPDSPWAAGLGAVVALGVGAGVQWLDHWGARVIGALFLLAGLLGAAETVRGLRRNRVLPRRAEVAGRVVSLWTHDRHAGEHRTVTEYYAAVDEDGVEAAVSYQVGEDFHRRVTTGDSVRLLVDPRRRRLVEVIRHERPE
ncbi:hypothetical protein Misp01_32890 [Microtetraspora sp. NBRC 13810]|uniref:hypothetical protein n=1 Tax=Microtetraspora sp. NBRC 13810 TaxID=3030990 RepID=UPI0024A56D2A|nr:hypothetical protein [Microtetraspora sp. NBRC 13810]GLW08159.1 hypothetical protein Misp01_32890 [Microtetraspora sp. NBRC 13810]